MKFLSTFPLLAIITILLAIPKTSVAQFPSRTIQLPTQSVHGVRTTVWVPDGGSAYLGVVRRSSEGVTSRSVPILGSVPGVNRLFRNRAIGRTQSDSSSHATVQIIDLAEMDRAILAEGARRRANLTCQSMPQPQRHHGQKMVLADSWSAPKARTMKQKETEEKAAFILRNIGHAAR